MVEIEFFKSLKSYARDRGQIEALWDEIEKNYGDAERHYHNIAHLDNLVNELKPFQNQFDSWDTVVMAIAYHDIVYNTRKQNNEEKSADLAVDRLSRTSFPTQLKSRCKQFILATKWHEDADEEVNLFTDADLSILGAEPEVYQRYVQQIRKEYSFYPDLLYKPGRRKVLNHFLQMKGIYKTNAFFSRYEERARVNLQNELRALS